LLWTDHHSIARFLTTHLGGYLVTNVPTLSIAYLQQLHDLIFDNLDLGLDLDLALKALVSLQALSLLSRQPRHLNVTQLGLSLSNR
jgi:hypothetical protein